MNKGFTLVEIISVITILGLLAIITTPAYDTISNNIKERNYKSKQSTIKAQTLSYIEKYLKNEVYSGDGDKGKYVCFTVDYLIHNGIISSDSDTEEYIENEKINKKFKTTDRYIRVKYDTESLKLVAEAADEDAFQEEDCTYTH